MKKETVVKVPFRKLKHIHHISDIQIRNLKRHKEYEQVFERTYEEVRKNKDNDTKYYDGMLQAKSIKAPDWQRACVEWITRRNMLDVPF